MAVAEPPRDLNTPHRFSPPATRREWEERAAALKQRVLFSAGLWPMQKRPPLPRARVTGRVERPDFTVEAVALETLPGFYLCGSLYRPVGRKGPFPAIANPHGHWAKGRLERQPDVPPAAPPPAPPAEGRGDLVAIGVNLARRGYVVFAYDMPGYADTTQVSHGFAGDPGSWLWGISLLGLQLWNGLRAVDYLESLPDVDRKRIGATGASGGGTQTFLLAAVDERVRVSVPVNMVSAHMQGGCLCENGPALRVGTDNVEIAALTAPRPQLLVSATGDWTRDNPTVEGPALKRVYDLYGAGERTTVRQFHYGHNFNRESRAAMYAWFDRWLAGRRPEEATAPEAPDDIDPATLRVWTPAHPRPADARDDNSLKTFLRAEREHTVAAWWPNNARGAFGRFSGAAAPALLLALGVHLPDTNVGVGASGPPGSGTLVVAPDTGRDSAAAAAIRDALKARGVPAVSVLALPPVDTPTAALWKGYFTTYNRTPLGDRVQAIVEALAALRRQGHGRVNLVGVGAAGPWALLARGVLAGTVPGVTAADLDRFPVDEDAAYLARLYAPGLRMAGGLRSAALLAAAEGSSLCLHNADPATLRAFADVLKAQKPRLEAAPLPPEAVADWLLAGGKGAAGR